MTAAAEGATEAPAKAEKVCDDSRTRTRIRTSPLSTRQPPLVADGTRRDLKKKNENEFHTRLPPRGGGTRGRKMRDFAPTFLFLHYSPSSPKTRSRCSPRRQPHPILKQPTHARTHTRTHDIRLTPSPRLARVPPKVRAAAEEGTRAPRQFPLRTQRMARRTRTSTDTPPTHHSAKPP